jgi:hypothetical protein
MIDRSFQEFVRHNLIQLDELARRYAEYRIEVSQSYLNELQAKIRTRTPAGHRFDGSYHILANSEQVCGWVREIEIYGTKTTAAICFAFHIASAAALAGGWPLMNGGCWTGIRVSLPASVQKVVLAASRKLALGTERVYNNWILWRPWEPLSATTIEGFHARVTGQDRTTSQDEIVEQLFQWKADFEEVLAAVDGSRK